MPSDRLRQALEAFSQIRDVARAKDLGAVALAEVLDYQISWDQYMSTIAVIREWQKYG